MDYTDYFDDGYGMTFWDFLAMLAFGERRAGSGAPVLGGYRAGDVRVPPAVDPWNRVYIGAPGGGRAGIAPPPPAR